MTPIADKIYVEIAKEIEERKAVNLESLDGFLEDLTTSYAREDIQQAFNDNSRVPLLALIAYHGKDNEPGINAIKYAATNLGADVNTSVKDNNIIGPTTIHFAIVYGLHQTVGALRELGARVTDADNAAIDTGSTLLTDRIAALSQGRDLLQRLKVVVNPSAKTATQPTTAPATPSHS